MQMPADNNQNHDDLYAELIVSGLIYPDHGSDIAVEVRRGMVILTSEGREAGRVAAVITNRHDQQVTHILLSRPSQHIEYRMVPIELVEQVSEETVSLHILAALVNTLPPWHK